MDKQFKSHPILLRFLNDELEEQFRKYYFDRFHLQTRWGCFLGIIIYGGLFFIDRQVNPEYWLNSAIIRLGVVCPYLMVMFWVSYTRLFREHMQSVIWVSALVAGGGLIALVLVPDMPTLYLLANYLLLIMFIYTFAGLRTFNALTVSLLVFLCWVLVMIFIRNLTLDELIVQNTIALAGNCIGLVAGFVMERITRSGFVSSLIISQERAKSESLLLNVLPESIVKRLGDGEKMIADEFPQATVLFADMVGFTKYCSNKSPREVCSMLNQTFSRFDSLVDKYEVEKIKTQGDCYIVTAGLPLHRHDHAEAIANLALDMRDSLNRSDVKEGVRIAMHFGISTGPISAGVIGTKKFIYDIWGDTVNIASRIQSSSQRGNNILVADSTYQALKDRYLFRPRGEVEVKGKGKIKVYYLEGHL